MFKCKKVLSQTLLLVGLSLMLPFATMADEGHGSLVTMDTADVLRFDGQHNPVWRLKADGPLLIGGYGDNFSYDGSRVTPLLGFAEVVLDAEKDTGTGIVKIQGTINPEKDVTYSGDIMLVFRVKKGGAPFQEGGVADFIYLHGNTKQDAPVMPKTRTYLGAWGETDVYLNGSQIYKNLMGHIMYTERTRDTRTRAIYNKDKNGFFSHKDSTNGSIASPDEHEIHFVAHSMEKDPGNFPAHSAWIHLNFENVEDVSVGSGKLTNCSCGANCNCPQDGKSGCKCKLL